jgi:hypothetical protein
VHFGYYQEDRFEFKALLPGGALAFVTISDLADSFDILMF